MIKSSKQSLLFIFSLLVTFSCKHPKKKLIKPDSAFTSYIEAYTTGLISNADEIIIRLTHESKAKKGDEIKDNIFEFTPSISGKTYWKDPTTIAFKPDEKLPTGTRYEAVFHLGKIEKVPAKLQNFEFEFQTKQQDFDIAFQGLQATNKQMTRNRIAGKITTADYANDNDIEKMLKATQYGKIKPITWSHNFEMKLHTFTIDQIVRNDNPGEVIIEWNGEPIGVKRKGIKKFEIPSLSDFSLINLEIISEPEQKVILYFSDPVNKKQNINGLIYFKSGTPIKISKEGNKLSLYPKETIIKNDTLIIGRSIRNTLGYRLKNNYIKPISFHRIKPAIKTIGKGVIMPVNDKVKFPFMAVNLKAVNVKIIKIFSNNIHQFFQVNQFNGNNQLARVGRVIYYDEVPLLSDKKIDYAKWNTFALDLSQMISVEPGAIYRVEIDFRKHQSLYNCSNQSNDNTGKKPEMNLSKYEGPTSDYYYYDEDEYYYSDYDYREKDNPCSNSYYYLSSRKIKQNILASNLGIIAKEDTDNTLNISVTDLLTTKSLSGVKIDFYNYQKQKMASTQTNSDGLASVKLDEKPFLLVAKKDKQYGYLRLDDASALSMSMFNVGGKKIKKGLNGYIYAERGVWRPGDSIYLNFILQDFNHSLPENHPVVLELYNPQNQLFDRKIKSHPLNNFYDFRLATPVDAPTGNWVARIKVGGVQFRKTLKIETIKPNRLKINLKFADEILHKNSKAISLEASWLHGAPASNLEAVVEMKTSPAKTRFKNYPDFQFDDPSVDFYGDTQTLFDRKLDAQGKAKIPLKLDIDQAPGMINLSFKTRVFEKGGDFSIDRFTKKYSPYKSYAGLKIPKGKGWNNALFSDEQILIPVVNVDEYGKAVPSKKMKVEVYEISWRWWWERDSGENLGYYLSSSNSKKILTDYINIKNGKGIYTLKFPNATWGRKFIRITDMASGHSTGKVFYTTYKDWWNSPDNKIPGGAEMLSFTTDKKSYTPGEEVKINLPVSHKGKALVSVENGSEVLLSFWTNVSASNHTAKFTVTKEMSPNVYVHISYIQPHNQTENDRPIRLYGVQNIYVENSGTQLKPEIIVKNELRPEKEYTIKVKEKNGKPMTYTLAVVDEGLLDLTHFGTPNPHKHFYARQALGVKTYDMYAYVMGAFSGKLAGLLAIGGDEDLVETGNRKANRFKPVVQFAGPFELKKGETKTHRFKMPNYIGSVRIMVVAGNVKKQAYGSEDKTVKVNKPLMVLTSLPRVLGPNEKLKLPVNVFVSDKKIKDVKVHLQTNDLIKINGKNNLNISFDKPGEQMISFDLQVARKVGIGKIKVSVESNGIKSYESTELQVRIANPEITKVQDKAIEPGENWTANYNPFGIKGTNKAVLEVSTIPPIHLEKRLDYLMQYPHGCIEQTVSSVFPQIYLNTLIKLSNVQKAKIQDNIKAGLDRLKSFQLNDGGFTYWPGESGYANDWGTNYAGHFMLEAKKNGYAIPPGMLSAWIKYQRKRARDWYNKKSMYPGVVRSNELIQAYRLFTLALAGKPELGAMNRLREEIYLTSITKWQLAAAYYLAGKESIARDLIKNLPTKTDNYIELDYTYGTGLRDKAIILNTLTLLKEKSSGKKILDEIASALASNQWLSTQTTAYSLMAISKFVGTSQNKNRMKFKLYAAGKSKNFDTEQFIIQIPLNYKRNGNSELQLSNQSDNTLFVNLINKGIPLESNDIAQEENLKMQVKYMDLNGNIIDETRLKQGTDFIIEVTIKHPGILSDYQNMALTEIFPSGWEITNPRMDNIQIWKSDSSTYQDIRDDRVMTYFDLAKSKSKTYRIMANASYVGEYYLPSIKCEAMYDNNIIAVSNGKWVKVVEK